MDPKFIDRIYATHQACPMCPSPQEVAHFFTELLGALFADFTPHSFQSREEFQVHMDGLQRELASIVRHTQSGGEKNPDTVAQQFFQQLPDVYDKLQQDIEAMFAGDPAAKSRNEVVRTYPGFYAIAAYRIANSLHRLGVKEVPRVITEHAHSKTGIDIHPGATIGSYFCIDHGTGIVIGETSHIGNHVKLYQGVTLGALSVNKEDALIKRHPTLEDHVVVYAGATILGGETVIGHHTVVGGNVWITRSIPANSKIYYQSKMYNGDTEETDLVIFKSDQSA